MSKVCIIGTHEVGKTTLLNDIRRELQSQGIYVPFIEERARQLLETYGLDWPTLDSGIYDSLQWSLYYYYDFSLFLYNSFISDRHHIDCVAYSLFRNLPSSVEMSTKLSERLSQMEDFEIYFYRPVITDDNANGVDGIIQAILDLSHIDYTEFYRVDYDKIKQEIIDKFRHK